MQIRGVCVSYEGQEVREGLSAIHASDGYSYGKGCKMLSCDGQFLMQRGTAASKRDKGLASSFISPALLFRWRWHADPSWILYLFGSFSVALFDV